MSLYESSVLPFKKMLSNVEKWLERAAAHAQSKAFDVNVLVGARLAPDQYPLVRQIQAACDAAKSASARLAGKEPPKHPDTEQTIDDLRARLRTCVAWLDTLVPGDFAGAEGRAVPLPFLEGKAMLGNDYLRELVLPNFYFHVTTAYAILRHNGVNLGKSDFIGALSLRDL
jgi:uncharacterized protein